MLQSINPSTKIPTFNWTAGGINNVIESKSNKYNLEFIDFYGNIILTTGDIFSTTYVPTTFEWNSIINAPGRNYFVTIKTYQTSKPATGVYYSEYFSYSKPTYDNVKYMIYPSSYNFTDSYTDTTTAPFRINDLTVTTMRKRCGFIQGECINLSPRKQGEGESYISYHLSKAITKIDVNLSLWSDSEYLKKEQSKVAIQVLNNSGNDFIDRYLVSIDSLSVDREKPNLYTFEFSEGITDFRIYAMSSPIGTANKGRVSIGNMALYY